MSYTIDNATGDIIIAGFEKGIGNTPYAGLTDAKSVNLSSIHGEASINFSTASITPPVTTGTVTSADTGADTVLLAGGNPDQLQAVTFTGASLPGGIVAGTIYWVNPVSAGNYNVYTDFRGSSLLNITSSGTGTFATVNMGQPTYFTNLVNPLVNAYFMVDDTGKVWTNLAPVFSGIWRYTGNTTDVTSKGNGIVSYSSSDAGTSGLGYIFVFRNFQIDVGTVTSNTNITWAYGWNPATGTTGNTNYLKAYNINSQAYSHESFIAPDGRVYFCDGSNVGKFYQKDLLTPVAFDPLNTATYIYASYPLLPINDVTQCLAPLGTSILIGGKNNIVYSWDTTSSASSHYILLAESNTKKIVTVNTTAYIFVGNRGRIYSSNGSQASPFKKVPDHISNTVEPYIQWQGAVYQKNRLFFGVKVTDNAGSTLQGYGGVWCVDLVTDAIYLSNQLSYGTYGANTYASAIIDIPASNSNPAGAGLFIGWNNNDVFGLDKTISTPYLSGQSYIISDALPIGTALRPTTPQQIEFKLSSPLLVGETVELQVASKVTTLSSDFTTVLTVNGDGVLISGNSNSFALQNLQWLLVKAILTGKASSPSYNRLTELRIMGATEVISTQSIIS